MWSNFVKLISRYICIFDVTAKICQRAFGEVGGKFFLNLLLQMKKKNHVALSFLHTVIT